MLLVWFGYRLSTLVGGILLMENERLPKLKACLLGVCDGIRGRMDRKYGAAG
jgi:hypothetical protein